MFDFEKELKKYKRFGSKLGLERVKKLLELLMHPENNLKIIHIAGTNGKGSTASFIYNILLKAGYKTGLFISPWVYDYKERMQVNGKHITDEEIERVAKNVFQKADSMLNEGFESPTEFEILTGTALSYFSDKNLDYVILETGLGGRFDSTNIMESPLLTVITSISFDHINELGDSIESIAFEKAGIIKNSVPLIANVKDIKAKKIIAKIAYEKNAPLIDISEKKCPLISEIKNARNFPPYQAKNIKTAIYAVQALKQNNGHKIERKYLIEGILNTDLPGRFDKIKGNIILDGSHNEAGIAELARIIRHEYSDSRILIVIGLLKDKNLPKILSNLKEISADYILTTPDTSRAASISKLKSLMKDRGFNIIAEYCNPSEAIKRAIKYTEKYDLIIGTGSFHLLRDFRQAI
ncbi:MAG: bifunctional folylpolyglutamate synthase/dihydrofolate synthase [Clostridiales Family XIII bacterium]|jgi:dihydrofolate synthase/folylpolyglutamate synthase|nr:bifunctional folylpolyglutamate synthase/dihydrofolate synthase [Clostridiales Family XIII bacterium]